VSVVRSVTGRIVRVVRTVVSVVPSVTAASVPRQVTARTVPRLIVPRPVSVVPWGTVLTALLAIRVVCVGRMRAVQSVLRRVTVRSVRRRVSVVRSVTGRIDRRPAIGPRAPTAAPTATVRIVPGVRRPTIAGLRRVIVGRRVTVRPVPQAATVPIAEPEQPDVPRATAASVRTRRAVASDRRRGSASARSVPHRSVGRVRNVRRATTSGRAGRPSRSASLPRRSPRTCCSRTWTARFGRGFAL